MIIIIIIIMLLLLLLLCSLLPICNSRKYIYPYPPPPSLDSHSKFQEGVESQAPKVNEGKLEHPAQTINNFGGYGYFLELQISYCWVHCVCHWFDGRSFRFTDQILEKHLTQEENHVLHLTLQLLQVLSLCEKLFSSSTGEFSID